MATLTFHLIPNAHLDPVWLWDWREGMNEGIITCRTMLDLMDRHPSLTFMRGEAAVYEHIERTDPATFERIRKYARQGRWDVVGGTYIQPDTNMPATETFARHYARTEPTNSTLTFWNTPAGSSRANRPASSLCPGTSEIFPISALDTAGNGDIMRPSRQSCAGDRPWGLGERKGPDRTMFAIGTRSILGLRGRIKNSPAPSGPSVCQRTIKFPISNFQWQKVLFKN